MATRHREPGWPKGDHLSGVAPLSQTFDYPASPNLDAAEKQARDWLAFIVATQGVNRRAGE